MASALSTATIWFQLGSFDVTRESTYSGKSFGVKPDTMGFDGTVIVTAPENPQPALIVME